MDLSVATWLTATFVLLPMALVFLLAFAGRSFLSSIKDSILLTAAAAGPSVLMAVVLGPWLAIVGLVGFFWWQWRTVE